MIEGRNLRGQLISALCEEVLADTKSHMDLKDAQLAAERRNGGTCLSVLEDHLP